MRFHSKQLYHLYNRSNNKELLFKSRENYLFFLQKIRTGIEPYCHCLAYCLMPTHFHFLIFTKDTIRDQGLNYALGIVLRSYTRAINKKHDRTGSLFQAHSKAKPIENNACSTDEQGYICFNYIHQNPLASGLVKKMEDWEFSSFRDYIGFRNGTFCNKELARELLALEDDTESFYKNSYKIIHPEKFMTLL